MYKATWTPPGGSGTGGSETITVKCLVPQYCCPGNIHWNQFVEEAAFLHSCDHT